MQINFTGYKNVGLCTCQEANEASVQDYNLQPQQLHFLNIQLTDDYNGKDLTKFKQLLKDQNMTGYSNPIDTNFLNITTFQDIYQDTKNKNLAIFVNNKPLPINDNNLPIISFIAKLIRRIKETPEDGFVVNNDYKTGPDVAKLIIPGIDLHDEFDDNDNKDEYYRLTIENIHSYPNVHSGTTVMLNQIQEKMIDYFS